MVSLLRATSSWQITLICSGPISITSSFFRPFYTFLRFIWRWLYSADCGRGLFSWKQINQKLRQSPSLLIPWLANISLSFFLNFRLVPHQSLLGVVLRQLFSHSGKLILLNTRSFKFSFKVLYKLIELKLHWLLCFHFWFFWFLVRIGGLRYVFRQSFVGLKQIYLWLLNHFEQTEFLRNR
jgi:hypothetical protein